MSKTSKAEIPKEMFTTVYLPVKLVEELKKYRAYPRQPIYEVIIMLMACDGIDELIKKYKHPKNFMGGWHRAVS